MKFFAVFAAILALATALPARTTWGLQDISAALQDPSTNPALVPFLEDALNEIMAALYSGQQVEAIALPAEVISPIPAVIPDAVVSTPAAASSLLVQIIVNVNQQTSDAIVPRPVPSPAAVPEINPTPVVVVDEVAEPINPTPVVVVEEAEEEIAFNPIDVIEILPAPAPVVESNPIDVIAIAAPEVNPVDIKNPVPVPVNPAADAESIWV